MSKPSILFLDIETAPDVVWTWGLWQANAIAVKENWYILSFAAKWRGSREIICKGLDDYRGYTGGDSTERALLRDVHKLLTEADIVVAHNGRDFDVKKLNARFIAHGMPPPSPYKVVDTKSDLKKVTRFSSNKLDWLCKQLELGGKVEHEGFPMWQGCMQGDPSDWKKMKRYNRHDIRLLEQLYDTIAPWIPQPNAGLWMGNDVCPNPDCGSKDLHVYPRVYPAQTRTYQRFQCNKCGTWGRSSHSTGSSNTRRAL